MMLQGLCFGEEAGARNLVFFQCKVAAGDDERYLVCAAGAAAVGLSFFLLPQCNGGFKLLWVCLCARSYRVFWNLCLQIALAWLHDVAGALFWGGSRSTKPCVFPCKVAAGDDERYLVFAAGAAAVGLSFFLLPQCNGGFKLLWVCLCVRSYRVFWNLCLQIALAWLHDVAWALFWGGSLSTKPCVFSYEVAAGGDKGTSCVRRARLRSVCRFFLPHCNGGCKLLWVWLCVCVVIGCFRISEDLQVGSHWSGCVKVAWCSGCMRNTIVFCS